ncbi:similar to smf, putative DNA processing chain A (drpA); putative exported protein [Cupriavidus taiwanensis]|uniref:Similar to smf, putative DNA processing chain A (DrpA) putative exported protein n=1 Tax=Cupriavidus taiwanensis TaxID=164546 RepID=A0A375BC94_9BURK|nr:similar to smf, putative DNA processing chain A (drpA); putative exported protein [Cupriavidus taiwanensis]
MTSPAAPACAARPGHAGVGGPAAIRNADDLKAWLQLACAPGVGPVAVRLLLAAFGMPQQVLAQSVTALSAVVPVKLARAVLAKPGAGLPALVERTLAWLGTPGNHLLTLADDAYPARLFDLHDPPPLLYIKGDPALLARPAVAIVGARKATEQGKRDAQAFGRELSESGLTVISGLALGIDAAAHAGGLLGCGGTIAVTGTGADRVYPPDNLGLAHEVAGRGAVVTEFPLGMQGMPANFPRRNRIIAALAHGVLVVEAAARSGSLITARLAAELGREVFAVPGSIHAPLSQGCHLLIRQGAKLVERTEDVLEEINLGPAAPGIGRPTLPGPASPPPSDQSEFADPADPLLAALGYDPVTLDALCERSGQSPDAAAARLLQLELAGHAERLPGNLFRRLA